MPSHQQLSWAKWWESCRTTRATTHTDCTRVVQHALVLGPGNHVQSDPTVCTFCLTFDSVTQPDPSQEPGKSESTCLALEPQLPRKQGFPEAVAARIEAPQEDQQISL